MIDAVFCESCGKSVAADATFCEHCGTVLVGRPDSGVVPTPQPASLTADPAPAPAGGQMNAGFTPQQAAERLEALTPGATELASQLAEQIKTPAVAAALAAGALAAAAVFAVGVVLALVLPDQSLLGAVDIGKGAITAGFAQMLNFLQVGYSDHVGKLGPALFLVFPIGACALAAASQARRTHGLTSTTRLASGAGVGLVFGMLMLIPALAAGGLGGGQSGIDPDVLGAVLLGILWGAVGGLLGTYYVVRGELQPGFLGRLLPTTAREISQTIFVALRPLALALAVATVVGTIAWTAETLLKSNLREGRSTLVATVDHAAYAVEHGVHWTELGGLAEFRPGGEGAALSGEISTPLDAPVPVADPAAIKTDGQGQYRVFGFNKAMPVYTFIPLLIFLIGMLLLLALNAGFAVARLRRPRTQWIGAGWGCLVGPIWAIAMVIVNALIAKDFFGRAVGDSVFGSFLLGGLVAGAIGGLLSTQSPQAQAVDPAVPTQAT
jgi:zinc-ribbon domain